MQRSPRARKLRQFSIDTHGYVTCADCLDARVPLLQAKVLGRPGSDFGRLIGASVQSVCNREAGKATPRAMQRAAIAEIRGIGKREAAKRLEAMDA